MGMVIPTGHGGKVSAVLLYVDIISLFKKMHCLLQFACKRLFLEYGLYTLIIYLFLRRILEFIYLYLTVQFKSRHFDH